MTYYVLAACAALAAFLALNAFGSLVTAALWLGLRRQARRLPAALLSRALFWLCVLPPACALIFVAAFLLPAYLIHEAYPAPEAVGLPLLALAVCSAFAIALALYRAAASWLSTRRLTDFWLRRAEPVSLKGVTIPAYRLRYSTPVLAVVGTLRPRLFIAGQVMDSLSHEELEMALAHERGHLLARDTLRRAVVHVCRDLLPFFVPAMLARAWVSEAERAADEFAARSGARGALALAAALIKIARLMPPGSNSVAPAGAFLLEVANDGVAGRVQRLAEMASVRRAPAGRGLRLSKAAPLMLGIAGLGVVSALLAVDWQVLAAVHDLTEKLIKLLA